jgi:hypothetical protein
MNNIAKAIDALSEITSTELDEAGIQNLCQLQYWLNKYQGAIFIKTVGKLDVCGEDKARGLSTSMLDLGEEVDK